MKFYEGFLIDGTAMLMPDENISLSQSDLDADDSGRDESGVMHRQVVRERVKTWEFVYSHLSGEEYRYMEGLFAGKKEFQFTFRDPDGTEGVCTAYCSNHSIILHNAKTGIYQNYKFSIIEC